MPTRVTNASLIALLPIAACATAPAPAALCWRSLAPPTGDEDLDLAKTNPSLASNGADDVWLSWSDPGARILRWTRAQWSPIAIPARPGVKAMGDPVVAAGPNGAVLALRANGENGTAALHVARARGGQEAAWEWLGPPLISSAVPFTHVRHFAVTVDAAGFPVVAWSEEVNVKLGGLFVARWDGKSWKRILDLHPPDADYQMSLGVAVDEKDRVWLTWTEGDSHIPTTRVRVSRMDGPGWTDIGRYELQTLIDRYGRFRDPSLAVGRDGEAWLAWTASAYSGTPSLTIAHWNGATWTPVPPPEVQDGIADDVAMMLNRGVPTVAWSQIDESENRHLYVADRVDGGRWRVQFAGFHLAEGVSSVGAIRLAPGPDGSIYVSWDEGGEDRRRTRLMSARACAAGETPAAPPKAAVERDTWPKTVDEAARLVLSRMSPEGKAKVRATAKNDLILFHHGWGTGIRNALGLWRGNEALLTSCLKGRQTVHPDDCSMQIIEAVWTLLQQTPAQN